MRMRVTQEKARQLARSIARLIDRRLEDPRDPINPATDGQVAVMVVFQELDRLGYVLVRL